MENEIGSLGKSYNLMTERIYTLMEQNVYEQKQKRKNELKHCRHRSNPHFLYNTLDSIIWMSEAGQNDEVVEMTSALAKLLRQSISNDNEQVELRQEIEYVKNYLTIQKMRYQDKLEYTIEIEPDVCHVMIVKLVLQPIVENAIYHGIKYKGSKREGFVAHMQPERMFVLPWKMTESVWTKRYFGIFLTRRKKAHKQNGVGVPNVQNRLKLYYGKNTELYMRADVEREPGQSSEFPGMERREHEKMD